jgi:diacylglycerol kinase family enzyme
MELLPEAEPDDGLLDVAVLTPRRLSNWAGLASNIVAGRRPKPWQLQTHRASRLVVVWPDSVPVELDGDLLDPATRLEFTLTPGALLVCVPDQAPAV